MSDYDASIDAMMNNLALAEAAAGAVKPCDACGQNIAQCNVVGTVQVASCTFCNTWSRSRCWGAPTIQPVYLDVLYAMSNWIWVWPR